MVDLIQLQFETARSYRQKHTNKKLERKKRTTNEHGNEKDIETAAENSGRCFISIADSLVNWIHFTSH